MCRRQRISFQFLIGRLETFGAKENAIIDQLFQFLIGRLETFEAARNAIRGPVFQFLIGRLETVPAVRQHRVQHCFNSS